MVKRKASLFDVVTLTTNKTSVGKRKVWNFIKKWRTVTPQCLGLEFQKIGKGIASPMLWLMKARIKLFLFSRQQLSSAKFPKTHTMRASIPK